MAGHGYGAPYYGAPTGQYYPPGGAYPPQRYPPSGYPSAGYSYSGYPATGYSGTYLPAQSGYGGLGALVSSAVAGFGGGHQVSHGSHQAHGYGYGYGHSQGHGHGHGHYGGKFSHGKHYGGGYGHGGKFSRKFK